jgi:hypothetical protein
MDWADAIPHDWQEWRRLRAVYLKQRAGGLMAVQYYDLTVELDTAPTITSTAVTSVTAGLPYRYDVQADDSDDDPLTYALSGAPSWLSIDDNGRITGSPGVAQIGTYTGITVTVTDQFLMKY